MAVFNLQIKWVNYHHIDRIMKNHCSSPTLYILAGSMKINLNRQELATAIHPVNTLDHMIDNKATKVNVVLPNNQIVDRGATVVILKVMAKNHRVQQAKEAIIQVMEEATVDKIEKVIALVIDEAEGKMGVGTGKDQTVEVETGQNMETVGII